MQIPQYIDLGKIYEDYVIAYTRVSSAGQDIQKQITHAEAYINNHNIDEEKVIWLKDDDVSANKLKMEDRPGLMELRFLIKEKEVKTIIAYSRDRLARNFYEYVALVKEFYQYGVNIIFTGVSQPPFSKNLSIEALYGIFAQTEGRNIVSRRTDTNKQFPSNIFGFKKTGTKKNTHYNSDEKVQYDLKSFLLEVGKVNKVDELFAIFMKYKKIFKGKTYEDLLRYLQNPFYSGHMETLYGYEKLRHVEPLITLEDFLANQSVLKKMKNEIYVAITNANSHGVIVPHCSNCKREMTFRSSEFGQSGYYICKKKHKEIKITVELYNKLIAKHLKKILSRFSSEKMKKDLFATLKCLEIEVEHKMIVFNRQLNDTHKEMTEKYDFKNSSTLKKLIQESRSIKQELKDLHINLLKIEEARNGINEHIQIIKSNLAAEIQGYDLYFLCNLFYSKIEVSKSSSLIYHVTFGRYFESEGYHELQA
jgi:site-specific DNA recombinase